MSMIVDILESFLGQPRKHFESKSQIGFDCPMCAQDKGLYEGDGKGNLEVNYNKGVYKCWACWERNNMHGSIPKLIKRFGNKQNYKDYLLVAPKFEYHKKEGEEEEVKEFKPLSLPQGFKPFSKASKKDNRYSDALAYVKNRGLTDDILKKYNIGFTTEGKFKYRIIIPSYDSNGELNYFIARSFYKWLTMKYRNPDAEKKEIIFNEKLINWDSTVYLVEGAFDHIVTPNSIPLLGKVINNNLLKTLQEKAKCGVVLVLDGGDEERKDAKHAYKRLNTLNLTGKVKLVHLPDDWDLSLLYQKYGKKAILHYIKKAFKLKESRL